VRPNKKVDVVGLGLNATDTVLMVREFPPLGGKERVVSLIRQAGGQIATALVACQRLGLRARYIGKVGDDEAGRFQLQSLSDEGVDMRYTRTSRGATTQFGLIIVDQATGERTVFWDRDERLAMTPQELKPEAISTAAIPRPVRRRQNGRARRASLWWQTSIPFTRRSSSSFP